MGQILDLARKTRNYTCFIEFYSLWNWTEQETFWFFLTFNLETENLKTSHFPPKGLAARFSMGGNELGQCFFANRMNHPLISPLLSLYLSSLSFHPKFSLFFLSNGKCPNDPSSQWWESSDLCNDFWSTGTRGDNFSRLPKSRYRWLVATFFLLEIEIFSRF